MLWIVRKINQGIKIGENIKISVIKINDNSVKFGIEAPNFKIERFDLNDSFSQNIKAKNYASSDQAMMLQMPKIKNQNIHINFANEITKQNEQAALTNKSENLGILEKFIRLFRLKKYLLS